MDKVEEAAGGDVFMNVVVFILEILLLYNQKRNKKLRWEFPSNMRVK